MASEFTKPEECGGYVCLAALRWADGQTQFQSAVTRSLLRFVASKTDKFGVSWRAQRTLSEETSFSERTIRNHLRLLEHAGLVRTIRRCRGGLRVSNVCHLIGWPGRKRLPDSGHPVLGRHVVEDAASSLQLLGHRHAMPVDAESVAVLNKIKEKKKEEAAEKEAILDRCLQSLEHWGTQKNIRELTRSSASLHELLRQGCDLHRHVLPAIETMVRSSGRIPRLGSWGDFAVAIARQAAQDSVVDDPAGDMVGCAPSVGRLPAEAPPGRSSLSDTDLQGYLEEVMRRKRIGNVGGSR